MKPFAEKFYKSKVWRQCRDAYFIYRHGLCERCGGAGKIVHHKTKLTPENIKDLSVALSWGKLELLCQDCHNKEHGELPVTAEGLMFDMDGALVAYPPR